MDMDNLAGRIDPRSYPGKCLCPEMMWNLSPEGLCACSDMEPVLVVYDQCFVLDVNVWECENSEGCLPNHCTEPPMAYMVMPP